MPRNDFINIDGTINYDNIASTSQNFINVKYPPSPLISAKGDGVTDDTTAIQTILNSLSNGNTLLFPFGTYIISANLVVPKNITILGMLGYSILKIKNNTRIGRIFEIQNIADITIRGITFDMNVQNTVVYTSADYVSGSYNEAIYCYNVTGKIDVRYCKFINLYNEAIFLYQTSANTKICENIFTSPAQSQNLRLSHIILQTISGSNNIIIENNVFDNTQPTAAQYGVNAIFAEGVKCQTIIRKNKLNWCGRDNTGSHRLLAIDLYGNCNYFTISDNVIDNCQWGFARLEASQDITVERNKFYQNGGALLTDPAIWITATTVYSQWAKNVRIKDNEFYANSTSRIINLIGVWTLDWAKIPQNIEIIGNSVFGQVDTFVKLQAGIDTIRIENNRCFAYDSYTPQKLIDIVRILTVTPLSTETTAITKGINIYNNNWSASNGAMSGDLSAYTGTTEQVLIKNNKLKGVSAMGDSVKFNNIPVKISNNEFSNNPEGIWITGGQKAYILNNTFDTMDNSAWYMVEATNFVQDNNYYNGNPIGEGVATIAASGTSIVVTHGLGYTPTKITITPQGNVGAVWVSSITSTQFTINCVTAPAGATVVSYKAK